MTPRTAGRIVGALFLAAFVFYGVGTALGPAAAGVALILLNSIGVALIGWLMRARLAPEAPRVAEAYLHARTLEAVLLAAGVWFLLADRPEVNDLLYAAAMIALAAGSVPMLLVIARLRWIPKWFAIWGIAGYALLGGGVLLDYAVPGAGLFLLAPGGLFELAFGILLLRKGFPVTAPAAPVSLTH